MKDDWNIIKGKLKQKWATLTETTFCMKRQAGQVDSRIQKRTGENREAIADVFKKICFSWS